MHETSRVGIVVRSIAAAILVGVGLFYANSAAYHWWLSWGPPHPQPELEARTAARHVGYAAVLVLGGAWVLGSVLKRYRQQFRHCADRRGFEAVQSLIAHAGLTIEEAEYRHLAFGSWVIRVTSVPAMRLLWEGKDGYAILEVETSDLNLSRPMWKTIWTGRSKDEQSAANVVKVLVENLRR